VEHYPRSQDQNVQQKGNPSSFHFFHEDTIDTTMTFTIYTTLMAFYLYLAFTFLALVAAGWVAQKIVVFVCVRTLGLGFEIVRSSKMIIFAFVAFVVRVVLVALQLFHTTNMLSFVKQVSVVKSDEKAFDNDNHKDNDDDDDDSAATDEDAVPAVPVAVERPLRRSARIRNAKKGGISDSCELKVVVRPLPRSAPIAASSMRRSVRLAKKARVSYAL
jgi:hypothetical protein